jgi:hypothetical protein
MLDLSSDQSRKQWQQLLDQEAKVRSRWELEHQRFFEDKERREKRARV